MANTVNILSYTNTFGDLLSQQNKSAIELNNLAANNYIKDTGTLYLNASGTGLSVTGAALFGSGIVSNNLAVGGDVTALSSVFINGSGYTLDVANNAIIRKNIITDNIVSNTYIRTATINTTGNVYANDVTSNNMVRTTTLNASGNAFVNTLQSNGAISGASANIVGRIITDSFVSNTSIAGSTLIVSNQSTTNDLQVNNVVNTAILVASNRIIGNNIQANTGLSSSTISVSGLTSTGSLQANNSVNTATLSVTGSTFTNTLNANNTINTPTLTLSGATLNAVNATGNFQSLTTNVLQANSSVITGSTYTNELQANNSVTTTILSVTGNTFTNYLTANTTILTPTLTLSGGTLNAVNATGNFQSLTTTGSVTVGGNFVITGQTVYATNTFTLSAGVGSPITSFFNVYRPASSNASIRWNETSKYWDLNNPQTGNFWRIVTDEYRSDITSIGGTTNIATSNAVNYLHGIANTANSTLVYLQSVSNSQNTTVTAVNNYAATGFARANTSANAFIGTTGSANAIGGVTTFTSTNGVTIVGSANTLTINTPQDVRTTSSPTFNALTLTNALSITQGGTSATSAASALTNLLPTGTTAGYVLTTGGPGTFYWSPSSGGGGGTTTPGTTINSTRLSYTGNGSGISYTTPTYIPGSSQLRVYFDGVRQFASEYTETSNSIVTFTSAVPSGVNVLIEVDGYINNPYYANNITFTAPQGSITASANTIQLAIQDLETRKAALSSASFIGTTTGITVDTNASNTSFATTAFVKNSLNNSNTYTISVSGNAGTVTNGVYTNGSYANPSWITSLANTKITGTFPSTSITGLATSATTDTTNASNISSGTLPSARISGSYTGITAVGTLTAGSIPTSLITGLATSATTDTTNASNISSGTLPSARISGSYTGITAVGTLSAGSIPTSLITGLATSATTDTTNAGNISSGTLASARLGTTGTPQFGSLGVGSAATGTTGEIVATNNITAYYSDERLKTKLGNIDNALDKLMSLNGFYYEANETAQALGYEVKKEVGVSAQEVQAVMPEVVAPAPIDNQYLTVRYERLVPLLIEAIKELKIEIDTLKGSK